MYMSESVQVFLKLPQEDYVTYDIHLSPCAIAILSEPTNFQPTVFYNVHYNVSITASLCGHSTTYATELYYGKPNEQQKRFHHSN